MHRHGHLGIGLLVYAPVAHVLVANGYLTMFGLGLVGMWFWSWAPDIDMVLPIAHRGPTHSIVAAGLAGAVTAIVTVDFAQQGIQPVQHVHFEWAVSAVTAGAFGFGIGVLGVLGHLLGDLITPMGIRPWWPFSRRAHSVAITASANDTVNTALFFLGSVAMVVALVFPALA